MDYLKYYEDQSGKGIPVFHGSKIQRGYGLGSIFRSFFRWVVPLFKTHAMPLIKEGAKAVGSEVLTIHEINSSGS